MVGKNRKSLSTTHSKRVPSTPFVTAGGVDQRQLSKPRNFVPGAFKSAGVIECRGAAGVTLGVTMRRRHAEDFALNLRERHGKPARSAPPGGAGEFEKTRLWRGERGQRAADVPEPI